jgi:hypothetical protein
MAKAKKEAEPTGNALDRQDADQVRTGVDIPPAEREVLQGSIDDRMAALLKDHQEMGVRPK